MTTAATSRPTRIGWDEFNRRLDWRQGEHVSIVGPTGQGKTYLAWRLLERRRFIAALCTKPKDKELDKLVSRRTPADRRFCKVRRWPPPNPPSLQPRVLIWPKWVTSADTIKQAEVMSEALDGLFAEGGWCVYVDELAYMSEILRLKMMLRLLWQQGRSLGLSVLGLTQRPAFVPLEFYSQATHIFFFRHNDKRDLDRIGGLGRIDPQTIREIVKGLGDHEFLYLNTRSGQMAVSKVEEGR